MAAAIILTALLVTGISVGVHIAVFYWIYKNKLKPKMTEGEASVVKKPTMPASVKVESEAEGTSEQMAAVLPVVNRNLAYGRVNYQDK